ncbi:N-6 DNA methylase [Nocardia sp. JW2]|uniref:N-6 DNA methylase n=1 Tax=Nocardia sp. JW2 TaxID=3450738 RepID=UPI003F43CC1A
MPRIVRRPGESATSTYGDRFRTYLETPVKGNEKNDVEALRPSAMRDLEALWYSDFRSLGVTFVQYLDAALLLTATWVVDRATWDEVEKCAGMVRSIETRVGPLLRGFGIGFVAETLLRPLHGVPAGNTQRLVKMCALLGIRGFERILSSFANRFGPDSGSYHTPEEIAALMGACAAPAQHSGLTIGDPYCRAAELVLAVPTAPDSVRPVVHAVGADTAAAHRSQLRLLVHDLAGTVVAAARPPWRRADGPRFDAVLTNPPFGSELPDADRLEWIFGAPPNHRADLGWLQAALAQTSDDGTAVVLMPASAAEPRDKKSSVILRKAVSSGALRAVIRLPRSLFPVTSVDVTVWVLRPPGCREEADGRVVFVDATGLTRKAHDRDKPRLVGISQIVDYVRRRVVLGDNDVRELIVQGPRNVARGSVVAVPKADIEKHGFQLTPDTYLGKATEIGVGEEHAPATESVLRKVGELADPPAPVRRATSALHDPQSGWKRKQLGELCEIRTGRSPLRGAEIDRDAKTGLKMLRPRDISPRRIDLRKAGRVGTAPAELTVVAGDLLFVRAGQVGEVALVGAAESGAAFDSNLMRLRPDPSHVDPHFLLEHLLSSATRAYLRSVATVNTVPSISGRRLRELVIDLPPLDEQREIVETLVAHERRIAAVRFALEGMIESRERVAGGLMNGTLEVRRADPDRNCAAASRENTARGRSLG